MSLPPAVIRPKKEGLSHTVWAWRTFSNPLTYLHRLNSKDGKEDVLRFRDGLKISIRANLWDARIVKEIFFQKPYLKNIPLPENPVVVDVGGYIGDFSLLMAYRYKAKVVTYEPVRENYEMLRKNIGLNHLGNQITAVNKGVSSRAEIAINVQILANEEVHASSHRYEDCPQRTVSCDTFAQILEIHRLDRVDLLKIDIEGEEYNVLSSIEPGVFNKINSIVFEYHSIQDSVSRLKQVLKILKSVGYTVRTEDRPSGYGMVYATRI